MKRFCKWTIKRRLLYVFVCLAMVIIAINFYLLFLNNGGLSWLELINTSFYNLFGENPPEERRFIPGGHFYPVPSNPSLALEFRRGYLDNPYTAYPVRILLPISMVIPAASERGITATEMEAIFGDYFLYVDHGESTAPGNLAGLLCRFEEWGIIFLSTYSDNTIREALLLYIGSEE